ncbi:MAG: pseudouridine-5'-phosphate glycosidase [Bacillota bacterium]|jgi:pseudouridine-5'-phosphate glycosidase|nr:pseudouridine-5'-phosphate glycosidase [Bacillota bacterium]HOF65172.1 pseudouridine-5'-phosphate glycosidase [Bacilli bacterium]HPK86295.1 pseudouridine-5'-phosphate glycosidase [Bacilli bacterium]
MKIRFSEEVRDALKNKRPLVALETTIISHGMPYPRNIENALEVEETIRKEGAIPATIGIIEGEIVVGLTKEEIIEFGKRKDIIKCSLRDLAFVSLKKKWGSTTVAASINLAKKAGIDVFVTGGIGGVHRNAEMTFDISADLDELAKTQIITVCAGPKAILDVAKTVEYLETKGVPTIGYKTSKLPLFYTPTSKFNVTHKLDSEQEIAAIYAKQINLGLPQAILVCNPVPKDASFTLEEAEDLIKLALKEAKAKGIKGKEETPFLLSKINELSKGRSQFINEALIINNAKVGAKIAICLKKELS